MAALAKIRCVAPRWRDRLPEADLNGGTVGAFMHRQNGSSGSDRDHFGSAVALEGWHTYAMEWTPNRCKFFIDGKSIGKSTSRIPNTPMRFACAVTEMSPDSPKSRFLTDATYSTCGERCGEQCWRFWDLETGAPSQSHILRPR